jgi:hypothetical protein
MSKKGERSNIKSINGSFLSNFPIYNIYFVKYLEPMETNSMLVIFALVAALGLVTVVAVDIILTAQEAEAKGCRTSTAVNASKGRCIQP